MSDGAFQEMTLDQWLERLNPSHRARRELTELRAALAQARRACTEDRGAPAWTPGPPTEPGEWEITIRRSDGSRYVRVSKLWQTATRMICDDADMDTIVAHRPYNPEPYRGEP